MARIPESGPQRFRLPWHWLGVLVLGIVVISALVAMNARVRIEQNRRQFEAAASFRLERSRRDLYALFESSVHLARLGALAFPERNGKLAATRSLTYDLYATADNRAIYGIGVFYSPGMFHGISGPFSVYEHRRDRAVLMGSSDRLLYGRIVEVTKYGVKLSSQPRYTSADWFVDAMAAKGNYIIEQPYKDGNRTFMSVVQAFKVRGRFAGVVIIDILQNDLRRMMNAYLSPGDMEYVIYPGIPPPNVNAGTVKGDNRRQITSSMFPFARSSRLAIAAKARTVDAENRRVFWVSAFLIVIMWCTGVLAAFGIVQRWRANLRARELADERLHLENEIALGKAIEAELRHVAFTDALTGLPNRAAFIQRVRDSLHRSGHARRALLFIDLDRFALVNETLGHLCGDELLCVIAARLRAAVNEETLVARLGGDEFVVFASASEGDGEALAARLLADLDRPVILQGRPVYPAASIGVVECDHPDTSPEELLRDADIAMYEAKHRGRAQYAVFDSPMRRRVAEELQLEEDLHRALDRGELVPYYQPIVDLATGEIAEFESLVRWQRHDGTLAAAGEFVPFAEMQGFAPMIDGLMLRTVVSHMRAILDVFPAAQVGLNVSAAGFAISGLGELVEPTLREHDIHPSRLKFEITETATMTNPEAATRMMEQLRELGIRFVLDDFGTGYSSLSYLQKLPIAGVKIDKSFVQPILDDPKALEIVRSVVLLARSFNLTTTAEGVETQEQCDMLAKLGVDRAQGFLFSPAVDIAGVIRLAEEPLGSLSSRA